MTITEAQTVISVFYTEEIIVIKGENADDQHCLFFPFFLKAFFTGW